MLAYPGVFPSSVFSEGTDKPVAMSTFRDVVLRSWFLNTIVTHTHTYIYTYINTHVCVCAFLCVLIAQSFPTLCDPMGSSLPGTSVYGILQARILEWVAIPFSRGSSQPRDQTWVSCIAGRLFTVWATREACTNTHTHTHTHTYTHTHTHTLGFLGEIFNSRAWAGKVNHEFGTYYDVSK